MAMNIGLRLRYLPYRLLKRIATYNQCSFWLSDLAGIPTTPTPPNYRAQWLTAEDLNRLRSRPGSLFNAAHAEMIENPQVECIAVFENEDLVGFAWIATGKVPAAYNHDGDLRTCLAIDLPDDMAFLFGVLVLPQHRGKRLYAAMVSQITERLSAQRMKKLLITTECSNYRALRTVRRMKFKEIGRTMLLRIGPLVWSRYPSEPLAGSIGIGRYAGDTRSIA